MLLGRESFQSLDIHRVREAPNKPHMSLGSVHVFLGRGVANKYISTRAKGNSGC